ncbi:MAG: glycosyltransferase, partial [Brevinematales bacterium]|nr:glycosyltransferase [Brevinematales bacterium]
MKFSFVIPSYNQGRFIKETIDSILTQDVEKEIIVMDGGSTDNTLEILKSYGDKIIWTSCKDKGQTDAINKGIKRATGDIITYINSDDYYLPGSLKIVEKYFVENPNILWLTGDGIIVNEDGKIIQKPISLYKKIWRKIPFFWTIYITNFIIQPSTFFRKEVFEKIGLFDENKHYTMDYDYWLRLYAS